MKLRLLTIGHSYVVGANRRLAHEMMRVAGERWEVHAAAPHYFHGENDLRPVRLELTAMETDTVTGLGAYLTRRVHFFLYGPKLHTLLARKWDVIHCWEEPYILAGGQIAGLAPRSSSLVFRTAQSISKRYPPPFSMLERFAMGRASGWLCSGTLVESNLRARPGYAGKPMRRIPLGVDLAAFYPDPAKRQENLRRLGWDDGGPPVVGFLGRFAQEKGLRILMQALDQVRSPWRALFVGAGALHAELQTWGAQHGQRVRILDNVRHDEVPIQLNSMDVLCAPSQTMPNWKEQFGRMLVEAFAVGVPVIGSDSGEIPYVLRDAGVTVAEKDSVAWARAIEAFLEDRDLRQSHREKGLLAARERYAWAVVAREHLRFFEELRG